MKVLSVGFGFVGKAYAIYLREQGHEVNVITANDSTADEMKKYNFSTPSKGDSFDAAVIAVPTPTNENGFDESILLDAVKKSVVNYQSRNVFIKSTTIVGNTRKLAEAFPSTNFFFYPEFLEAKNPIGGVFNQKIKVFGSNDWDESKKKLITNLFHFADFTCTSFENAEMVKYAHNMWLAANISYWNSIKILAGDSIDMDLVLKEVHKSEYFGTHPWKIGFAYGGTCLPKDIKAFIRKSKDNSVYNNLLKAVDEVNEQIGK
ncbi:MAG: hypothetical protein PHD05_05230 [Sphaerochaetaceae bacterium]|nr:hypothetical protein [Sphaerochaetaceae bacterium]